MSLEDKLLLIRERYDEKKGFEEAKGKIKADMPLTKAQKLSAQVALRGAKVKEAKLVLEEAQGERDVEKWEETKKKNLQKHKAMRVKYSTSIQKFDRFINKARSIANDPNLKYTVGKAKFHPTKGTVMPFFTEGGVGEDVASKIDNLLAMGAINTIQQLKASSSSGATGFGALNREELKILMDDLESVASNKVSVKRKKEILLSAAKFVEDTQDIMEKFATENEIGEISPENTAQTEEETLRGKMKRKQ